MRARSSEASRYPLLIEPANLLEALNDPDVIVIDLSMPGVHKAGHVPGALWLSYPRILFQHDDTDCDIPPNEKIAEALSFLGIQPHHHIVAYDSQGCPMAARLLWTLDEIGHRHFSMLNGGWAAWQAAGLPQSTDTRDVLPSVYPVQRSGRCNILRGEIGKKLYDKSVVLLDCRTEEEYTNELVITDRGGHIPGAVHFDWNLALDESDAMRLRPLDELREQLQARGVTPDKEIIVYCQTHMRSAYVYILLRLLGFSRLRGYAAGYSEWGNALDTPIANAVGEEPVPAVQKPALTLVKSEQATLSGVNPFMASTGNAQVEYAENRMIGIQHLVKTHRARKPFQGLRISGCLRLTAGVGALIKALVALGASVRWADVSADNNANNIATCLLGQRIPVFICALHDGEPQKAQRLVEDALVFPGEAMPQVLIDDNDESCLLSIREHFAGQQAETPALALDQISDELNADSRKLLVELMLLAKWELRASEELHDLRIWAADPMVCHCNSVVLLKHTLCACA